MRSFSRWRAELAAVAFVAISLVLSGVGWTADPPAGPGKMPADVRKRLSDTKYWYGVVHIVIRGSGSRSNAREQSDSHYSIHHEATIKFRLSAIPGELSGVTSMQEIMSKIPNNPQMTRALEQLQNHRHWMSPYTNKTPDDETDVAVQVQDRWDDSGVEPREGPLGPKSTSFRTKDGTPPPPKAMLIHQLQIDFDTGTYDLTIDPKSDLLDVTEKSGGSEGGGPSIVKSESASAADLHFKFQPLPKTGRVLAGTVRIPKQRLTSLASRSFGSIQGTITWTLSPTPLDDVELVLKPDGYNDWLPRGGKDEKTEGNTLRVDAILRKRGGGSTTSKMTRLVVTLNDVSREPGVCLNQPLTGGATSPDLDFVSSHNPGVKIQEQGLQIVKEGGGFNQLPLTLSCYDWGAWGTIEAQAELDDGRYVWATLDTDESMQEVRIPKRDADSKIADKWKSDMDATSFQDNDDTDKQTGNGHDGDGLTTYEEYRGLIAKGKHTRDGSAGQDGIKPLTPTHKDLIVHNTIKGGAGGKDVAAGFLMFEKASGIHIVEVDDGELPESRQVNVNKGSITAGPQFGLRLFNDALSSDEVGATTGTVAGRLQPPVTVSPKGFPRVAISVSAITSDYQSFATVCKNEKRKVPFTLDDDIAQTVAHELAHGLGVVHHGSRSYGSQYKQVTGQMTSWKVYDRDGNEITTRPFDITGGVGNPGSESSGDVNCIMCYNDIYNWCYDDRKQTFRGVPFIALGTTFCTSVKGTGPNASLMFGDASAGNCLGKMRVKDQ